MRCMDRQPNHDDARLLMKLYELRRDEKLRAARDWFARNFNARTIGEYDALCPPGSQENTFTRMVTSYWDMAASFVSNGVLHDELFFQNSREMLLVWERVKPIVGPFRKALEDPAMWSNLEAVGTEFERYWSRVSPGSLPAFAARIHAMAAKKS